MLKRIDHIELLTASPDRMLSFYKDVLGFNERERLRIPDTGYGPLDLVYMELGGTTVEVMTYPEADIPGPNREMRLGYQLMALEVDDMEATLRMLKAKGVEPSWGPIRRLEYARAEICDPDGNGIELRQWRRGK